MSTYVERRRHQLEQPVDYPEPPTPGALDELVLMTAATAGAIYEAWVRLLVGRPKTPRLEVSDGGLPTWAFNDVLR